jgi:hypothetical protein
LRRNDSVLLKVYGLQQTFGLGLRLVEYLLADQPFTSMQISVTVMASLQTHLAP